MEWHSVLAQSAKLADQAPVFAASAAERNTTPFYKQKRPDLLGRGAFFLIQIQTVRDLKPVRRKGIVVWRIAHEGEHVH